jgi:AraC-like DNA-binding protein
VNVLYLSAIEGSPSHAAKLAGIRRYCSSRGWEAVPVFREAVSVAALPALLAKHRPVGCVVEGVGRYADLPPRLFRGIPVSYIGYPRSRAGRHPNFHFDADSIARTAFRELSSDNPVCYAVVGHPRPWVWSRRRVRAFRAVAAGAGARCLAFPAEPLSRFEPEDAFVRRLASWLTRLPEHCAVFAVSDETALLATRAAHAARRPIPRSLTLLSVDNFADICENADPPISSIQLDFEREGYLAARALTAGAAATVSIGPLLAVRRRSTAGRGRREKFVLEAIDIIRREAADGLSAAELAARFSKSRRLFDLRFREATGHSVLDEILHVRLEKAFVLLSRTDTPVAAIAHFCGFRSYAALRALFRRRTGLSMEEWRRRNAVRR